MKKGMTRIGLLSVALIGLTIGANAQWTETATSVYLTNGTKPVGIGTNAPSYPLDIKQAGNSNFRIQSTTSGSANLILSRSAVAGVNCLVNYKTGVTNLWLTGVFGNTQDFRIRNGVGTDNLFISQATGYLGINNTSPATQLDITGLSNWDLSTTPGDVRIGDATNNIRMGVALAGGGAGFATIAATNSLQLGTGSSYPNLNTLNINGGRVGIGTTTPGYKLHVAGANPSIVIEETGTSNANIIFNRAGVSKWYLLENFGTPTDNIAFYDASTGTKAFQINQGGNVGIGTSTATNRLYVNGDAASTNPVLHSQVTYLGTADVRALEGISHPADGYGYGAYAEGGYKGVYGFGNGGAYIGSVWGLQGYASTSAGTAYGVYGSANGSNAENSWGGFFPTKTYTSELRVGGTQGATGYVAAINGKLIATEVRVELQANWPDYVFSKEHNLMSIEDLETSVNTNSHLPGVPSACEVEENGIMLGEMQTKTMEKVEENTLYIIQLNNKIKELEKKIEALTNNK